MPKRCYPAIMLWAAAITLALVDVGATREYELPDGEEPTGHPTNPSEDPSPQVNLPTKTLGGAQLWSDQLVFHDWRIQRHAWTGHFRLLDDRDVRQQWGSWDVCLDELQTQKQQRLLPPLQGRVVLVLHGLGRTRHSMDMMVSYLRDHSDFQVLAMGYPSTRQTIQQHAADLRKVIDHLGPEVTEINFVAHSLGNLVIRQYLHEFGHTHPDARGTRRVGRFVMLAPPNQDACITRLFRGTAAFQWAVPGTGKQISAQLPELSQLWGTPRCEFAIIAGGKSDDKGWNPLLEGDDDLIVRVEETRLAGAKQFFCVPLIHTFMMDDEHVQQTTLEFLRDGHSAERSPPPIPQEEPSSRPQRTNYSAPDSSPDGP